MLATSCEGHLSLSIPAEERDTLGPLHLASRSQVLPLLLPRSRPQVTVVRSRLLYGPPARLYPVPLARSLTGPAQAETMDEKLLPQTRRFSAVGFSLTAIRIWQWSSSFFVYASFGLLYHHIQRNRLGENGRMKTVEFLGLGSFVYTTIVVCSVHGLKTLGLQRWRVFAIVSLLGDLAMMGIYLVKITILSFSGLPADCHGLTRDNYNGSDLIRQPTDGYNTIRFGSWSTATTGELDRLCTFPRTVYGLSVVAIFSYTFSILLSVLYVQQDRHESVDDSEKASQQPSGGPGPSPSLGHAGDRMHAPSILDLEIVDPRPPSPGSSSDRVPSRSSSPPQGSSRSTRSSRAPSTSSQTLSVASEDASSWAVTTLVSDSDSVVSVTSIASGGTLPPRPLPGSSAPPQRRWSTSTSSSYNADAFLVTDGFRSASDPPAYSSRPGSLYQEPMKYDASLGMPGTPQP